MSGDPLGFLLYLFALMLPASMVCWTVVLLALGHPRETERRPRLFSLVARLGMLPADPGGRMIFAILGLIVTNGVQVAFLIRAPIGAPSGVILVYFIVQGALLAIVLRQLRVQPRGPGRGGLA